MIDFLRTWIKTEWLYLGLLIALFFFFGFDQFLFELPQGIHFTRQTDSLSFASLYYRNGMHFFQPEQYNLVSIDGKAACEFPIIYYLTACIYQITGENWLILKSIHLLILWGGLFSFLKLSKLILKDHFLAFLAACFLFTSTVFNYYSFNFLPDIAALGLTLMGLYHYFKFKESSAKRTLIIGFALMTLAGLIKVTYLITPLAILCAAFIDFILHKKKITGLKTIVWLSISMIVLVGLWNLYALAYNQEYASTYFTTSPLPYWDMNTESIQAVYDMILNHWFNSYFADSSFHALFLLIVAQVVFFRKSSAELNGILIFGWLGLLAFFFLFFRQFQDHDYYFLTFLPIVLLTLLNGLKVLIEIVKNKWAMIAMKLALLTVLIVGMNYSHTKLTRRQSQAKDLYSEIGLAVNSEIGAISRLGIPEDAIFVVGPDLSFSGALYFLHHKGFRIDQPDGITLSNIQYYQDHGAEYFMLVDLHNDILGNITSCGEHIYSGKHVHIFKLPSP